MTTLIIQARTGSSRLPNKMVLPFYKESGILEILVNRIQEAFGEDFNTITVATTKKSGDDAIVEICKKNNIHYFRGSENDVLKRFIGAANEKNFNKLIRVCADNVFLDVEALKHLYDYFNNSQADYISYKTTDGKPSILTHYGFWAEAVSVEALKRVAELTDEPLYHEHVTNYIYTHPDKFKIEFIPLSQVSPQIESCSNLRLTIDTQSDFDLCKRIYSDLTETNKPISPSTILEYVISHPEILAEMEKNINNNQK